MSPGEPTCRVSTTMPPGKLLSSLAAAADIGNAAGYQKEKRYFSSTYWRMRWETVGGSGRSAARAATTGAAAAIVTAATVTRRQMAVMASVSLESASLETGLWPNR